MAEEMIQAFLSLSTPTISDALDLHHLTGGCLGLRPVVMGHKIAGPAFRQTAKRKGRAIQKKPMSKSFWTKD